MPVHPRICVEALTPAQRIEQVFMISQPQLRTTSRGDYYVAAFLSDRTGKLNGRMWQASEMIFQSLPTEGYVWVKGRTENYQDSLQLVIDAIRPVEPDEVDPEEFIPCVNADRAAMFARVRDILDTIETPALRRLVDAFLSDEELMDLFCKAPAAIVMHHAYLGGLLQHTLGMLETGARIAPLYSGLNVDLVLVCLFLHDIGKTRELAYDVSFHYTDQGQLLGHLYQGTRMIEEKIQQLNTQDDEPFPQDLANCLLHVIVAHHGQREYGCPVLPATPEAFFVHYLDNLDAKMNLCFGEMGKAEKDAPWTNYVKSIETRLYCNRP